MKMTLAWLMTGMSAAHATESPYFEEMPLVLSATRLPQPLHEVPGAVTVIDRELIAATGYRDLARVLRLVAGMQVGQERGHAQWVTYHGLSNDFPTEMQVLIDGRSVITPSAFGGVDWSGLPLTLDEIDRIEIVRGTNPTSFGANAFLGVINIITRHSAEARGLRVGVRGGHDRVRDAELTWSGGDAPLTLRASAATQRDGGFDGLHDSRRTDTFSLRGDLQLSPQDSLLLRAATNHGRRSEGYADSVFGNNGLRDSDNHSHTLHLQWQHNPSADEEWLLNYYRNHERIRDEWLASAPPFFPAVPLNRNRDSVRDNFELQHRSAPLANLQLVWGAEARRDDVDAPFLFYGDNPDPQYLYRLFGNVEWRALDTLTFNLGAAHEKYSGASAHFSPRLFANWQASPADTLRMGFARAYRQHNPFERYGDIRAIDPASGAVLVRPFLPNPNLKQPRIDTIEAGYFGRFDTWNTTLDVRVFNEHIHDFVVRVPQADPSPAPLLSAFLGSTRYENLGPAVRLRGIEYELVTRPAGGTELRLAHSLIDRRSNPDIEDRSAPYTTSLSWLQDYGRGWKSMLSVLRMGPLAGGDGYVPRYRYLARPYTTLDANLSYATRIGRQAVQFALTALNLGAKHQEIADRSQQAVSGDDPVNPVSRTVYLSVSMALE
ncbi:TonB-dependent receptor plug domain-containing protein [Aromatoleum diolicum]|uniref:TonB-dependent receptor plug domain-containing protein n=1 Tax=Aromatoleum diolicum TaxID=75796 RepID=A0ABX1QAF9_9RHOO|nr:TonB-dependent receptor [Aromatoleum diolicum]NMG75364.1 TonB-dependent receptor plug domain-containing protein [Aromatoleum diolicum]